jgi:hypothetical protein
MCLWGHLELLRSIMTALTRTQALIWPCWFLWQVVLACIWGRQNTVQKAG